MRKRPHAGPPGRTGNRLVFGQDRTAGSAMEKTWFVFRQGAEINSADIPCKGTAAFCGKAESIVAYSRCPLRRNTDRREGYRRTAAYAGGWRHVQQGRPRQFLPACIRRESRCRRMMRRRHTNMIAAVLAALMMCIAATSTVTAADTGKQAGRPRYDL